jgi:SAM-dependent methyltransferase
VLEIGCGRGGRLPLLAQNDARTTATDISGVAIKRSRDFANRRQLEGVTFCLLDAEAFSIADGSFDIVFGTGILHHLDLNRAFSEVERLLDSEGMAIFVEPLGHNPIINLFRRLTPGLRTRDEHPIRMRDLRMAEAYFGGVETHFFHLSSLLAVPFRAMQGFTQLLRVLDAIDKALFNLFPPLRSENQILPTFGATR